MTTPNAGPRPQPAWRGIGGLDLEDLLDELRARASVARRSQVRMSDLLDAVVADPSTGIAECDAYVAYFKACTVMIAGWTPASAQDAADVMIGEFTVAGATAGGKAMTAAHCVTELATYRKFAAATCPGVK